MAKIVVGVDGSDAAKEALRWAVEEGHLRDARVVALHAWQVPVAAPDIVPTPRLDLAAIVTGLQAGAEELLETVIADVAPGEPTVEKIVVEAPPASALIEAARDAELLVVGSRGRGGFAALVLGSVSHQCAQHSPCPVVIHRSPQRD